MSCEGSDHDGAASQSDLGLKNVPLPPPPFFQDPNHLPARTTVEARLIRPDMLIEVDATAALPPRAP